MYFHSYSQNEKPREVSDWLLCLLSNFQVRLYWSCYKCNSSGTVWDQPICPFIQLSAAASRGHTAYFRIRLHLCCFLLAHQNISICREETGDGVKPLSNLDTWNLPYKRFPFILERNHICSRSFFLLLLCGRYCKMFFWAEAEVWTVIARIDLQEDVRL